MKNDRYRECKHCKTNFDLDNYPKNWMANHVRWCDYNPKRKEYTRNLSRAREAITPEKRKTAGKKVKNLHAAGHYDNAKEIQRNTPSFLGKTHDKRTRKVIREKALKSRHRRLRRKIIEYNGILLDSTWELALAKRLDELGIEWIRPNPIPWQDKNGDVRNYFPDFYLPEHDVYLDPKNKHAINVQREKLEYLLTQYKNIVILNTIEQCNNFSLENISPRGQIG